MYEKILVPLDGSKVGEAALPHVEDIVSKMLPQVEVEIILLQVLAPVAPTFAGGEEVPKVVNTEEIMEKNRMAAMDYLNKVAESLRSKGATVTPKVAIGNAAEQIVEISEEINANLIAMSTHGRSGLSRWAFGSITDKVLRMEGKIPIAIVRAPKSKGA